MFIAKNCFSIYTKETQNEYKASFTSTGASVQPIKMHATNPQADVHIHMSAQPIKRSYN